jgi:N4-gp56 family major capsid protein
MAGFVSPAITGTTPTMVDSSILEVWAMESLRREKVAGYWGKFVGGEASGMPIIQKTELLNKPGDLIHVQITDPLTGAGVEGDTTRLVEMEENLATTELKLSTVLYRHAVRVNARAEKKSILDLAAEARMRLDEWLRNKMDILRFTTFMGTTSGVLPAPLVGESYTPNVCSFDSALPSGLKTALPASVDDVDTDDYVSVKGLQALRLKLEIQTAKPLMVDGSPHYIYVAHPYAFFWLKQDTRYEAWVREARERSQTNPLFSGALAVIDGMILHSHVNVPTVVNAGTFNVSKGIAFGAEAFVEALDENIRFDDDDFDYGNQYGLAIRVAFSARRALELSSIIAYANATAV